jgi:hypothetical protein
LAVVEPAANSVTGIADSRFVFAAQPERERGEIVGNQRALTGIGE